MLASEGAAAVAVAVRWCCGAGHGIAVCHALKRQPGVVAGHNRAQSRLRARPTGLHESVDRGGTGDLKGTAVQDREASFARRPSRGQRGLESLKSRARVMLPRAVETIYPHTHYQFSIVLSHRRLECERACEERKAAMAVICVGASWRMRQLSRI
ncbi:hypothetical protein BC826DRAFT_402581 [Russula brevipes]|nr:hypothetical protein BC826DRAFT_402581 [Russula brevipes]